MLRLSKEQKEVLLKELAKLNMADQYDLIELIMLGKACPLMVLDMLKISQVATLRELAEYRGSETLGQVKEKGGIRCKRKI